MRMTTKVFGPALVLTVPSSFANDSGIYSITPHTARQIQWRDGHIRTVEGAVFLGLRLAPVASTPPERYTHVLPANSSKPSVNLPVYESSRIDGELSRVHPFEYPFARVLVYWGCGESVSKGQPRVHAADPDQVRLSRRLAPSPALTAHDRQTTQSLRGGQHYAFTDASLDSPSTLEGKHVLQGPTFRHSFQIAPQRGFLPPVDVVQASISTEHGAQVKWESTRGAVAYFASTFLQHAGSRDVVVWTSSRIPEAGWLLARDHPGREAMSQLLARGVLLPPEATSCTLPRAVLQHARGTLVLHLSAYGEESKLHTEVSTTTAPIEVQLRARATTSIMFTGLEATAGATTRPPI